MSSSLRAASSSYAAPARTAPLRSATSSARLARCGSRSAAIRVRVTCQGKVYRLIKEGGDLDTDFEVQVGGGTSPFVIGREGEEAENVQLRVGPGTVSARHCRLQVTDNVLTITDLASTNGTFINGRRIPVDQPMPLTNGSVVTVGEIARPFMTVTEERYCAFRVVDDSAEPVEKGATAAAAVASVGPAAAASVSELFSGLGKAKMPKKAAPEVEEPAVQEAAPAPVKKKTGPPPRPPPRSASSVGESNNLSRFSLFSEGEQVPLASSGAAVKEPEEEEEEEEEEVEEAPAAPLPVPLPPLKPPSLSGIPKMKPVAKDKEEPAAAAPATPVKPLFGGFSLGKKEKAEEAPAPAKPTVSFNLGGLFAAKKADSAAPKPKLSPKPVTPIGRKPLVQSKLGTKSISPGSTPKSAAASPFAALFGGKKETPVKAKPAFGTVLFGAKAKAEPPKKQGFNLFGGTMMAKPAAAGPKTRKPKTVGTVKPMASPRTQLRKGAKEQLKRSSKGSSTAATKKVFDLVPVDGFGSRFDSARTLKVKEGSSLTVGRGNVGSGVQTVSGRHVRLEVVDGKLVVEDLDSTNGTFVNGRKLRPLEERALKAGDKITLGDGKRNADADTFATYEVSVGEGGAGGFSLFGF